MLLQRDLVLEEPFIDVVIHQLVVEGLKSEGLVFLGTHALLLSLGKLLSSILVNASKESIEILEIVGAVCKVSVEILLISAGRLGICCLQNVGCT